MTNVISEEDVARPSFGKMLLAFGLVIIAYALGFVAAWGIIKLLPGTMHILWATLIADIGATIVVFIFSMIFNNVSFYDPYWSLQPIAIAIYWMILGFGTANLARQIVVVSIVSFWGIRLTLNWARGWEGVKHEDWRYVQYRKNFPKLYWFIAFTGLEMMPTLVVYLGCMAMYHPLVVSTASFNFLDGIGILVAFGAALIEFIADEQMKIFRKKNKDPEKVMDKGLWGLSRHPNYFGEVTFWWGLYFFALASIIFDTSIELWQIALTLSGPIAMLILFYVVSIPLLEKKQLAKRSAYADYKKRVSMIIPWFPRNK